jgi:hypothetical protein
LFGFKELRVNDLMSLVYPARGVSFFEETARDSIAKIAQNYFGWI